MAAVLAAAPAVASHSSAAYLWNLLRYRPETIEVTVPTARRARREFRVHHSALTRADLEVVDGIPVASLPRTLLDLAVTVDQGRLDQLLERAEALRIFDLVAVDEVLGRFVHHPGGRPLRLALESYRDDPQLTRSTLERKFRDLVLAAGLPPPSMNFNVAGFEIDAYWKAEALAVELDTFPTHGSRAAFERDRARDERLRLSGIEVVRITDLRIRREPARILENLVALLERRRRGPGF